MAVKAEREMGQVARIDFEYAARLQRALEAAEAHGLRIEDLVEITREGPPTAVGYPLLRFQPSKGVATFVGPSAAGRYTAFPASEGHWVNGEEA